jgi:hypothetical protein
VGSEYGFVTLAGDAMDLEMTEVLFTSLLVQATNQLRIIEAESRAEQAEAKASATTLLDFMDERDIDPETAGELVASILTRMRAARQRNPAFRRSFLVAYAQRIGVRLTEAARATAEGAEAEVGGAFLPVLARRARSVDAAVESMFGVLRSSVIRATDAAGWAAGTAAADLAELSVRRRLPAARTG